MNAMPFRWTGARRFVLALAGTATLGLALCTLPARAATPSAPRDGAKQCRLAPNGKPVCLLRRQIRSQASITPSVLTETVLPNQQDDLEAWVEYNPTDCTLVSSGQWTVTTAPVYGNTSTGIFTDVLSNGDCPGVQFPYALISYTWTSTDEAAQQDVFDAFWSSPDFVEPDHFVMNLATVKIGAVNLGTGKANVTITGPSGATGTLTFEFSGASVATATQTTQASYGSGAAAVTLDRPSIAKGVYDALKVKWNASTPPVFGKLSPSRAWNVLGTIRYSQYNTPVESACTGSPAAVWVVDSLTACNFTATTLDSAFAAQVNVNGTGSSTAYGIVKTGAATSLRRSCRGHFPPGATLSNSYLQVPSVTGSCNSVLTAGTSVATHPTLGLACGAGLAVVQSNNTNQGNKSRADTCPACNGGFNGTDGHIDSYTADQACTAHDVGDLGNFWTVQTR